MDASSTKVIGRNTKHRSSRSSWPPENRRRFSPLLAIRLTQESSVEIDATAQVELWRWMILWSLEARLFFFAFDKRHL